MVKYFRDNGDKLWDELELGKHIDRNMSNWNLFQMYLNFL